MRVRLYGCRGHRASCGPELLRAPQGTSGALMGHPERVAHSSQAYLWSSCPTFSHRKTWQCGLRRAMSPFTTGSGHNSCAAAPSVLPRGTSQWLGGEQRPRCTGASRLLLRPWPRSCECPQVGRPHRCPPLLPRARLYREFVPQLRGEAARAPGSERRSPANMLIFIFLLFRPFCVSILVLRTGRSLLLVLHRGSSPVGSS